MAAARRGSWSAPDAFIPALEESGLIVEVGAFVLNEACRQTRQWRDAGLPTAVSVNVSPRQFETGTLVDEIRTALDDSGLDPTSLILEMTETTLDARLPRVGPATQGVEGPRHPPRHRRLRHRLLVAGLPPAVPRRHPQDRPDVHPRIAPRTGPSTALVHALIELGNALGLKTVAEGIETVDQLMRLKHEGCDAGQGFYFSRPLEAADAERFLAAAGDVRTHPPITRNARIGRCPRLVRLPGVRRHHETRLVDGDEVRWPGSA